MKTSIVTTWLTLASSVLAGPGPIPADHILYGAENYHPNAVAKRATSTSLASASQCTNSPYTRSCWYNGYGVADDFDAKWPNTGVTRQYTFTATNTTCNPDGHGARVCLLFNNQFPGPTLTADWGDMVSVTIVNKMQNNGTGVHFHGIRQLNSNLNDGVGGITECPIPPGGSRTYTWRATQFGSSWYHSHFSVQYGEGLWGAIVINGPASSNYDLDLGPVPVCDWTYRTANQVEFLTNAALQAGGPGPKSDTILIGGMNKNSVNNGGSYAQYSFTQGKKHLLRLFNSAVDNAIRVSIDNHQMQIITSDLVPIKPISVDSILLSAGQRYNVIVTANQTVGNYWMRATTETACQNWNNNPNGLAIVSYSGAPSGIPTTKSTAVDNGCTEPSPLTPWVPNTVGSVSQFQQQANNLQVNIDVPGVTSNNQNIVVWGVNMTGINVAWDMPTLSYVFAGNTTYPETYNLIETPNAGTWSFWIIQETAGGVANIAHPIHLHGHDFYLLGTGTGTFDKTKDPQNLQYSNPTRRDTVILPAGGWLVIAWPADNPGAWLMHCHIAWHVSQGLGVQFLESKSSIPNPGSSFTDACSTWESYMKGEPYPKLDSGLKRRSRRQFFAT